MISFLCCDMICSEMKLLYFNKKGLKTMIKIDIISGFLGAGKTTLIKKLLKEALNGQKVVLIENEFGEIGIDGGFLKEAGIEIREMNSGCICCSLVGDFGASLKEVIEKYEPERILIEPSGVGKLSDVTKAVDDVRDSGSTLNSAIAVVDAVKCKMYLKNFGEFFINQIENAGTVILSRTDKLSEEKVRACVEMIRRYNETASIITTPWDELEGKNILEAIEKTGNLEKEMLKEMEHRQGHHGHCEKGHHHHHEDGEECCCGHHEEEHHHHHEDGEECCCGHHEEGHHHHHEDGEECCCGHHEKEGHHHHEGHDHHHHHADEVFGSWGFETPVSYGRQELEEILDSLSDEKTYGIVLRAKGMLKEKDKDTWIYFDYVPGEMELREGKPEYTGKVCVIGSKLNEYNLKELFRR